MWIIGVPPDVIKTRIQNSKPGQYPGGMSQVVKELIAKEGISGMYRGIGPALIRAYPANAACFLCSDEASMITGTVLEVDGGRCI